MVISVDWDGTAGADPELFEIFIVAAKLRGHVVLLCTQRNAEQGPEIQEFADRMDINVVWAYGFSKLEATANAGFPVDVWIDDNPISVYTPMFYRGEVADEDGDEGDSEE